MMAWIGRAARAIPIAFWVLLTSVGALLVAYLKGRSAGRGAVLEDEAEAGRQKERRAVKDAAKRKNGAAVQEALDRKMRAK